MTTPIELLSGLVVGVVELVAPDEIRVLLELEAPQSTALNTGVPTGFPRLNGYVLIPNEAGATVAYITWIGIERSPYPKRSGLKDFGLIDLPSFRHSGRRNSHRLFSPNAIHFCCIASSTTRTRIPRRSIGSRQRGRALARAPKPTVEAGGSARLGNADPCIGGDR